MAERKPNGMAVAAFLSSMIGLLVMGIVNVGTEASDAFNNWVLSVGQLWIPNAQGIGPYSGKETFLLLGWLLSWVVLHFTMRKRDIKLWAPVMVFVVGMALATLFIYMPFIDIVLRK